MRTNSPVGRAIELDTGAILASHDQPVELRAGLAPTHGERQGGRCSLEGRAKSGQPCIYVALLELERPGDCTAIEPTAEAQIKQRIVVGVERARGLPGERGERSVGRRLGRAGV